MIKAGIYLHIPFCKSRCSYCDFATNVYRNNEGVEHYVNSLCSEIRNSKFDTQNSVETIYFGGGTPSLLSPEQLENILAAINEKFRIEEKAEFTLEMNPATVSIEKLEAFKSLGVNRASFGVQTFDDKALKILARGHNADDARTTFKMLREAGFENISFDLIAGLPNQSLKDWKKNLDEALELNPEHLSLYLLEIHEGTPLAEQISSKRQPVPDEDLAGEMYELMVETVQSKGFKQYEISNFSKPSFESKHNNKYWLGEAVFGFGVSAHSFDGIDRRWSNERDTNKYVTLMENGESPIVEDTKSSQEQLAGEYVFLRLRLNSGVDTIKYQEKFGRKLTEEFSESLKNAEDNGLIEFGENRMFLTDKGRLFSNEVFSIFV